MTRAGEPLTSGAFSKRTGLSISTITKMLRQGALQGQKIKGKWAIDAGEVLKINSDANHTNKPVLNKTATAQEQASSARAGGGETYDVNTFARMTYLTEKGVRQWLKTGRLSGSADSKGNLLIDADNLDRPELRHLIRK